MKEKHISLPRAHCDCVNHYYRSHISLPKSFSTEAPTAPTTLTTVVEKEKRNFQSLAESWWDERGQLKELHSMNRLRFVENQPSKCLVM